MSAEMKLSPEETKQLSRLTKEEWREYTKTVWQIANVSDRDHPAVFPEEIPRRLIKMFSFVGETVLDPFAGTGTTARVAVELGRNAICVEQNPLYAERMVANLNGDRDKVLVEVGDCRDLSSIPDGGIDLVVTSPPYWNKADYGGNGNNLGSIQGYQEFLRQMRGVFVEAMRVLKPGRKICIVTANVNQHTDFGLLTFPLASDFTNLLRETGFVMITEVIWNKDGTGGRWGSANQQRPIFGSYPYPPNFLFKNVHEYVLVFAKPPKKAVSGPKVVSYLDLMELDTLPVDQACS
jgi:site-specific DNA-methyltransferase (adenine-specific)